MRYVITLTLFIIIGSLPRVVQAAVSINEIAWMGDSVSANHEWIELYNDSDNPVVVDGWTLSDGMNLSITLVGTINPLGYAVLERTSDDSAPGTAFLLYTGALVNTGATLRLLDNNGLLQDQVAGGENWQGIGGDNVSKETAQYSTSGWLTAVPTPGRVNGTETTAIISQISGGESAITKSKLISEPTKPNEGKNSVTLTLSASTLAYVNESIDFSAALRLGTKDLKALKYTWNFGDLNSDTGAKISHRYRYPGTYLVTVKTRYADKDYLTKQKITILPVTLSLARSTSGDIQIQNNAQYEMDISGYKIVGTKSLVVPDETIILPRGAITIPRTRLEAGGLDSLVMLYDATGQAVAYQKPVKAGVVGEVLAGELRSNSPASTRNATTIATPITFIDSTKDTRDNTLTSPDTLIKESIVANDLPETIDAPTEKTKNNWPYLALIALLSVSLIILWLAPKPSKQTTLFD